VHSGLGGLLRIALVDDVPVHLAIPKNRSTHFHTVRPVVVNADILPTAESPGHDITVTALPGDCPPTAIGMVDMNGTTPVVDRHDP